jgi:site-specific DNA recombinase
VLPAFVLTVGVRDFDLKANIVRLGLNYQFPYHRSTSKFAPASTSSHPDPRPIRAETRAKLVTAIAKGRHWLDELIAGTVTNVDQIAATAKNCTARQVNMTISLAFLAPSLVKAAVDGRLPRGVGIANLRDAPAEWSVQHARLGPRVLSAFLIRHYGARNRIFSTTD